MANYATLKAAIRQVIKQNGNNEITGALLQQSLLSMITSLGAGYQFIGIAVPATNPGTPDQNVFYLAATAGTYTNFGGIVLSNGEFAILKYNGSWTKEVTGAATSEEVSKLQQDKVDIKPGVNLFNKDWLISDYVMFASGQIIANNAYSYTPGYIKVNPNTTYHLSGSATPNGTPYGLANANTAGICFYDENYNYLSGVGTNNTSFTTPANCAFIRISAYKIYLTDYPYVMLNQGATRATWVDFNPIYGYLSTDVEPTQNSGNLITSGGVYDALEKINGYAICDIMKISSVLNGMTYSIENGTLTLHQNNTGNQAVGTPFFIPKNVTCKVRLIGKCATGTQKISLGIFSSNVGDFRKEITLSTTEKEYIVTIKNTFNRERFNIGIFSADVNVGNDIIITALQYIPVDQNTDEEIVDLDERVTDLEEAIGTSVEQPITFFTDGFAQSLSKESKYLTKLAFEGDSLTANPIGGPLPNDEGETMRPMRMEYNNIPRRMYDFLSWNKPTWRRLDNADWTKSGFSLVSWSQVFEGEEEKYYSASQAGSYVEITVPSGKEHFAIICRTKSGNGKLNVTINGNLPSSITYKNPVLYGNTSFGTAQLENYLQNNSVVNQSVCPINLPCGVNQIDLNVGVSPTGNPYAIFEFNNLPSGQANTIRFTTVDSNPVDIWGGFYWSGKTLVVMNIAHGGHTSSDLISQHLSDELYNGGYDAVVFEFPEMNNTRLSVQQTESDINSIITQLKTVGIDFCFTSCNIMGLSIPYDVNYFNYSGMVTDQLTINNKIKEILFNKKLPFVDLFQYFRWLTENKGGTLSGGQAGLFFTNDGQHGNILGVTIWAECLKQLFYGKSIKE